MAHPERTPKASAAAGAPPKTPKKAFTAGAWEEARALIWTHRKRLALGLGLMIINRLSGLVLPTTTKYLMDDVIAQGHWELLPTLAMAAGAATLVDAGTAFANSQVLGVAAQRAITEMRKDVEAHVMRLPIRYFDSTKSGILISRIMTDAEGIRNLVGTGLVQLTGSILTAAIAMCVLLYLNWKLTVVTIADSRRVRRRHGHRLQAVAAAVPRARPDQRRSDRPARRIARRRPHRQGLHGREARGARLREGRAPAVQQRREVAHRRVGHHRVLVAGHRRHRHRDDADRRQCRSGPEP